MSTAQSPSLLSGIMITAGSAIGAGMFSLPIVSSGMWWWYSLGCLFFLWLLNYLAALYLLEVNLQFSPGASFDTIATNILGSTWNTLIGLSVAFLMYILLYAYFSAFGNIVTQTLQWDIFNSSTWWQGVMSLALGCLLGVIVWWSTAAVGRISTILVGGMVITFILSIGGFALQIEPAKLFNQSTASTDYFPFVWAALPYYMTSLGYATLVPSLYKFYGRDVGRIKNSLLGGSLIAAGVYALFLLVAFGNISRQEFIAINEAGGNIGHLVNAFEKGQSSSLINTALRIFSNFAIVSSFLGISLGLFDYIADKFSFANTAKGRLYTACLTFLPAGIASFFFPNGFIAAIGYAGLMMIFGFFIAPFFMIRKTRKNSQATTFQVGGGMTLLLFFLLASLLVGVCKILTILKLLPQW